MNRIFANIKGDRKLLIFVLVIILLSFIPVYSASSNLANISRHSSTVTFLVKHFVHVSLGLVVLYFTQKFPYKYFKKLRFILLPAVAGLLLFTLAKGTTIGGANASRWIRIPGMGTFQPSTAAGVVLMIYVAGYLSKYFNEKITFVDSLKKLWLPVFAVLMLILPANFSTTAIIFTMVLIMCFIGRYPVKYLLSILGIGVAAFSFFILMVKAFPDLMPNRVDTWVSRIESFSDDEDKQANYQVEKAKIAIASGGLMGRGPGKSVQKNFLPQSSSDFIYAIVVEEFGLIGGVFVVGLYLFLLYRVLHVSQRADSLFGQLLVLALGIPIVFQSMINMAVAVQIFPVTGQTLPLISSGGTSIWMTCFSLGVILGVSGQSLNDKSQKVKDE